MHTTAGPEGTENVELMLSHSNHSSWTRVIVSTKIFLPTSKYVTSYWRTYTIKLYLK